MSFKKAAWVSLAAFLFVSDTLSLPASEPSSSTSDDTPKSLTLVAYNLRNYLSMERRVNGIVVPDAPKPPGEVDAIIEGLSAIRPDILGVEEIGDASFLADLQTRLAAQGIDLPYTELVPDSSGRNQNIALLSRFPILESNSRRDYTYVIDGVRYPLQRGILDVTILVTPHYRLRYIGLHLKSKRPVPGGDESLIRLNEARLVRTHIDHIFAATPDVNLIVAGDFNELRSEAPLKALQGAFGAPGYLTALTLADRFGFRWTHHWTYADLYSRFDYVLYSKGISREIDMKHSSIYHWENWDRASDHRPLVVRIHPQDR